MRSTSAHYIWIVAAWAVLTCVVSCQSNTTALQDLPACGQLCFNNLFAESPQFGCPFVNGQPNATCLCQNADFGYGVRDCATEACPNGTNVESIIQYGIAYCSPALGTSTASLATAIYTVFLTTETAVLPTDVSSLITTVFTFTYSITNEAQFSSLQSKDQSSSAAAAATRQSAKSTPTATPSSSIVPASSHLSTGAKAGIGVGVALGVLFIMSGVLWFLVSSRRKKKRAAAADSRVFEKQELDSKSLPLTHGRSEVDEGRAPVELSASDSMVKRNRPPGELEGTPVAELSNSPATESRHNASGSKGTKVRL